MKAFYFIQQKLQGGFKPPSLNLSILHETCTLPGKLLVSCNTNHVFWSFIK